MMIDPQDIGIVSAGVYVIIPPGYTEFMKPKLGIPAYLYILVLTGTIDSSYWGIVQIMLFNCNKTKGHISKKSYIVQLVVCKVYEIQNSHLIIRG